MLNQKKVKEQLLLFDYKFVVNNLVNHSFFIFLPINY